ncbi:CHAT domain-containing protein [Suillus clintonianus]|uniref:CHAT domain-containing protein n=1 Tax=Suillus clintonianus TaxID=1904413 RepID=UPI001B8842B6|nr:CHAT domain-containing protein [Suillus clintonianus]KAG2125684.1 CHAT domain-containing protein [Suillus clintonianus]
MSEKVEDLRHRFQQLGVLSDLDEAVELHQAALQLRPPRRGIRSDLDEAIELHRAALLLCLPLAPRVMLFDPGPSVILRAAFMPNASSRESRLNSMTSSGSIGLHYSSVPPDILCDPLFETDSISGALCRAVFWTQLARFRSPLDYLSLSNDTGAALAEEFKGSISANLATDHAWEEVILRIRMLPDFSQFLLPPLFSDLQKAAEGGPVIISSMQASMAVTPLSSHNKEDTVHVPLDITRAEVYELSSDFQSLAEQFGSSDHLHKLVSIVRKLWHDIVDPVVQALRESTVHPGSRIWWCPTAEFTLLPQDLTKRRKTIYLTSISPPTPRPDFGYSRSGKELQCVVPELAVLAQRVAPIVSFTSLTDSHATNKPFESSFAMRDGPLMIKDIIRSHWQNPQFAFLSACHTTVGDKKSPDESIHLAAAMQFSGFRSVIGSMWSVDDDVARQVVSAFYGNLVDGSGRLDCTRAAVALHKAVKSLRKKIPLEQQIVFVHIGV